MWKRKLLISAWMGAGFIGAPAFDARQALSINHYHLIEIEGDTTMKSAIKLGLAFTTITLGALGAAPNAHAAVITDHSGTICKNYNASDATQIDYLSHSARSIKASQTFIICPLTRNTSNSKGAVVYVDILHLGPAKTTTCTAYSHNYNGAYMASTTQTWTGVSFHEFALNLTGDGKSGLWSNYSVVCYIPGNRDALIYGVELSEQ